MPPGLTGTTKRPTTPPPTYRSVRDCTIGLSGGGCECTDEATAGSAIGCAYGFCRRLQSAVQAIIASLAG